MEVNVSSWGRKGSTSPYYPEESAKRREAVAELRINELSGKDTQVASEDPWDSNFDVERNSSRDHIVPRPRTLEIRQTREWSVYDSPMPEPLSARRRNSQTPDWDSLA